MTMPQSDLMENGRLVEEMWRAVKEGELNIKHIPRWVEQVIDSGAWRKRWTGSNTVSFDSFLEFISTPRTQGLGWDVEEQKQVERLLRDAPNVLTKWRQATTAPVGGRHLNTDNISIEPQHGTSRTYTLDRLQREAPELYDKVKAKEMSANAAAIEAGFRKKLTPFEQIKRLFPKLNASERKELRAMLDESE